MKIRLILMTSNAIGLVSFSVKDVLLDIACAVYFTNSDKERTAKLYRIGTSFDNFRNWTLEELLQHAPEELPDFEAFIKEWIFYLQTIEELSADEYLEEALEMQTDPVSALETARQSVQIHPELYLKVLSMQDNDKSRLEIGLEALRRVYGVCYEPESVRRIFKMCKIRSSAR